MAYSNRELVEFYISYKLSQRNHPVSLLRADNGGQMTEQDQATPRSVHGGIDAVKSALLDLGEEFGSVFARSYRDVIAQLHITPETAHQGFDNVMDELFRDGISWGRIIGLFVFGSTMCLDSIEHNMSELVPHIADWMTTYLDEHIIVWIQQNGGWDRLAEIFGKGISERRSEEAMKKWLFIGLALLTGVLTGVLISDHIYLQ